MINLTLIRGLPGSGKSTLAKAMVMDSEKENIQHVEADDFFMGADGSYHFDPAKLGEAHTYCQTFTEYALKDGADVVVANTFTRRWEMQPYLDLAEKYGATVTIIVAKGTFPNVHGVPQEKIDQMKSR